MSNSSRKPLLDQLASNPAVQSGYTSLLCHVLLGLLLVVLVNEWKTPKRPPPLLIAFGESSFHEQYDDDLQLNHVLDISPTVDPSETMETADATIDAQPQISINAPLVDTQPLTTVDLPVQAGSIVLEGSPSSAPTIQEA